jgi:indole-3-glycerol phosphate synthase
MTTGRLDSLVAAARDRVVQLRSTVRRLEQEALAAPTPKSFGVTPPDGSTGVIAEVKRRSPSAGAIQEGLDVVGHARAYEVGGATAVSVLTEESGFGGSMEDLRRVTQAVGLPVLRKDFILDELQLIEARAAGAAAVLLIARILTPERLAALDRTAHELGLATLVEVHTIHELDAALAMGGSLVGVNSRDLDDFTVDLATAERLLPRVPSQVIAVAESGIETREDVVRLAAAGADAVLVGSALARLGDPRAAVRSLTGVPRRSRREVA